MTRRYVGRVPGLAYDKAMAARSEEIAEAKSVLEAQLRERRLALHRNRLARGRKAAQTMRDAQRRRDTPDDQA